MHLSESSWTLAECVFLESSCTFSGTSFCAVDHSVIRISLIFHSAKLLNLITAFPGTSQRSRSFCSLTISICCILNTFTTSNSPPWKIASSRTNTTKSNSLPACKLKNVTSIMRPCYVDMRLIWDIPIQEKTKAISIGGSWIQISLIMVRSFAGGLCMIIGWRSWMICIQY